MTAERYDAFVSYGHGDAADDVRMLCQQRAALGDQEFQRILHTLMDNDDLAAFMQVTEQEG